jgi:hypothetical protein
MGNFPYCDFIRGAAVLPDSSGTAGIFDEVWALDGDEQTKIRRRKNARRPNKLRTIIRTPSLTH